MLVNLTAHQPPPGTMVVVSFDICNIPVHGSSEDETGTWVVYSKDNRIYIIIRKFDHTWGTPVLVTKGNNPFITYSPENEHASIVFEWNGKIQRLSFLPSDLGFFQEPMHLWDCVGCGKMTSFPNFDASKRLNFACNPNTVSQADRRHAAYTNCIPMVSCVEDWPGAQPTPQNITISGGDIQWNHTPDINGMVRQFYRIYKNGIIDQEVPGTEYIKEFIVSPLTDYAVTSVYTWCLTGIKEYESCKEYNTSRNFGFGQDSFQIAEIISSDQPTFQNPIFSSHWVSENTGAIPDLIASESPVFFSYFITKLDAGSENCLPGPIQISSTETSDIVFHSIWPAIIT